MVESLDIQIFKVLVIIYHILPNYRTYPYKHTIKQFLRLKIAVCNIIYFIIAYVVGTHLNCLGNSNEYPQHMLL